MALSNPNCFKRSQRHRDLGKQPSAKCLTVPTQLLGNTAKQPVCCAAAKHQSVGQWGLSRSMDPSKPFRNPCPVATPDSRSDPATPLELRVCLPRGWAASHKSPSADTPSVPVPALLQPKKNCPRTCWPTWAQAIPSRSPSDPTPRGLGEWGLHSVIEA